MPMTCIKTGCTAYCDDYGETLHGDLFEISNGGTTETTWLMRVCSRTSREAGSYHTKLGTVIHWFDDRHTSGARNSTLICRPGQFQYEGGL